jgi:hypothetical protein
VDAIDIGVLMMALDGTYSGRQRGGGSKFKQNRVVRLHIYVPVSKASSFMPPSTQIDPQTNDKHPNDKDFKEAYVKA